MLLVVARCSLHRWNSIENTVETVALEMDSPMDPVSEQEPQQNIPVQQEEQPQSFTALSAALIAQIAAHEEVVVEAAAPAC